MAWTRTGRWSCCWRAYPHEPVEAINAELLAFAVTELAGNYAAPEDRPGRRRRVAQVAERVLHAAEPGSDRQLGAARALISASDDPELLQAWRSGSRLPDGLPIDAELRWSLICRLASLGELDATDIERELVADDSSAGVVHAARARALRPDPAAKRAAWTLLTTAGPTPAYELYATAEALVRPDPAGGRPAVPGPVLHRDADHRRAPARLGAGQGDPQRVPGVGGQPRRCSNWPTGRWPAPTWGRRCAAR